MNYIRLINQFWQRNCERPIGSSATALYFYLLNVCNSLYWKNPFSHSDRHIASMLGLSVNTIRLAKKTLQENELIKFTPPEKKSKGIKGSTIYWILTVSNIDTDANTVPDTDADTDADTIYKPNETKPFNLPLQKKSNHNGSKKTAPPIPAAPPLILPHNSEIFKNLWQKLRESSKWKNKSLTSLNTVLDQLGKYEEAYSCDLINRAIAGDYKAIVFNDTDRNYEQWKKDNSNGKFDSTNHPKPISKVWKT